MFHIKGKLIFDKKITLFYVRVKNEHYKTYLSRKCKNQAKKNPFNIFDWRCFGR
jgi:hypothetical protein